MKVSDIDSESDVYDNLEEAEREFKNKGYAYAIQSFKINNKKYFLITYE